MKKVILILVPWFLFATMVFAAQYDDTTVKLFKVEDLADPLDPKTYFLTISETKGYKIVCPTGTIQKGLGFWDANAVETLDSGDEEVTNTMVAEQPELLCEGAPGYEGKKPKLFVVRGQNGDEYFLWYSEKANLFYSPGCQELIDALGLKNNEATEISEPEAILTVPTGNEVKDQILNINCYDGTPPSLSLNFIYLEGETDGTQAFNNHPECEGALEPPTQNKYPGDPRANERYNSGYRKAFIKAKATYVLGDYECKINYEEMFKVKGREAFINSSPSCPDLPDISGTDINEYPHENFNIFYVQQYTLGFNEAKQDFETTMACLEGIEHVAAHDVEATFLTINKSCTEPIVKPEVPQKYPDKPHWTGSYADAFSEEFAQLSRSWKQENCAESALQQGEVKGKQYYTDNSTDYNCMSADTAPQLNNTENPYKDIAGLKELYENGFEIGFLKALKEFKEGSTCISEAYGEGKKDGENNFESGNYACTSWPGFPQIAAPYSDANRKQKYREGFKKGFENAREAYVMGADCNKYTIVAPKLGKAVSSNLVISNVHRIPSVPRIGAHVGTISSELPSGHTISGENTSTPIPRTGRPINTPNSSTTTSEVMTRSNSIPIRLAEGRNRMFLRPGFVIPSLFMFQPCKNIANLTEWINPVQGNVAKLGRVVPFCIRFDKNIKNVKVYYQKDKIADISEQSEMVYKVMPRTGKYLLRFEAYNQRGRVQRINKSYRVDVKPKNEFSIHKSAIGDQSGLSLLALEDRYIITWRGHRTENPSCQVFTKIYDRYGYTIRNDRCLFSSSNLLKVHNVKYKDKYYVTFISDLKTKTIFGRLFKADGNPIGNWQNLNGNDGSRIMAVTSFNNGNHILASGQNVTMRKLWVRKYVINIHTGVFNAWNLYTTNMVNAEKMYIGDIFNLQNNKWGVFFTAGNSKSVLMLRNNTNLIKEISFPKNYGMKGLSLKNNRVVVVYEKPLNQNANRIVLQQFDSNGNYIGNLITLANSRRSTPSLIDPGSMGFDITKISANLLDIVYALDHSQNKAEIYRVRFNTSGQVIGQKKRINDTKPKNQILPRVVSMNEGSTIVGWTTFHKTTKPDLSAKLFDPDGISY